MMRMVLGKVMWVGRATVFLVGLSVILALTVGVVSRATAHTGSAGLFHLGHNNPVRAVSTLAGGVANSVLNVSNTSTATTATAVGATNKSAVSPAVRATNSGGGPALGLSVGAGKAPMTVSGGRPRSPTWTPTRWTARRPASSPTPPTPTRGLTSPQGRWPRRA